MKVAHSLTLEACGNPRCRSIHIVFQDEHGEDFASAALLLEMLPSFVHELQNYAYEVSVERDG